MKKIFFLVVLVGLAGCYCKPQKTCPSTPTNTPVVLAATPKTATATLSPEPAPVSAPQPTQPSKQTTGSVPPVKNTPQSVPAEKTPALSETAQPAPPQPADDTFTPQKAAALIAQDRAQQTLHEVPADFPSFKKEEILPTQGRLFNPLAYEPLQPDNTHAPWSNESLKYGIYYSFIKAGTAYIKTRGIVNKNGKSAYLIQTTAFSASVIDSVYKVRDINYSWLDTTTLHSLGYSQSLREGNYKRDEWLRFDNENGHFYGEVQKKEEPHVIAGELDQEVLDILTSLYFVRAQPLQEGKDLVFDIVNREKQYPLLVKVLGKETVKTSAGKFNCWVVEPQLRGEGIFVVKGKSLKVWLTDDAYRMPVKMSVEVFIGSVSAELLEYTRN